MERALPRPALPLKKIVAVLVVLLGLLLTVVGAHILGMSTYFSKVSWLEIHDIAIDVDPPLTRERVEKLLPDLRGKNLLTLSSSRLNDLLKKENWIGEVSIRKVFPDRLEIQVRSKRPIALRIRAGVPYFIDDKGLEIERVGPSIQFTETFPVVSVAAKSEESWAKFDLPLLLKSLKERLPAGGRISEVTLSSYPIFHVFLSAPQMELVFHHETWESQLVFLQSFLRATPARFSGTRRINLTLPKKAVVSSMNSQ